MSNSNHRFSSHLLGFDDSFEADESLLVSPAPKAATGDFDESCNFRDEIVNEEQVDGSNNASNLFSDSSDSFDVHTPMKQKFSYKSAMDALDELQSTSKKVKRRRRTTMFSPGGRSFVEGLGKAAGDKLDESYTATGNGDSFLAESHYHGFSERLDEDSREDNSLVGRQSDAGVNDFAGFDSKEEADDELNYAEDKFSGEVDVEILQSHDVPSVEKHAAREVTWDDEQQETNTHENSPPTSFEPCGDEQRPNPTSKSSVFRNPCIRHNNSSEEDDDLELKLGHPVNQSFSETTAQYEHDDSRAQIVGVGDDVLMAVEDDANGTCLDRVDPIGAFVGEQQQSVLGASVKQDDCESGIMNDTSENKVAVEDDELMLQGDNHHLRDETAFGRDKIESTLAVDNDRASANVPVARPIEKIERADHEKETSAGLASEAVAILTEKSSSSFGLVLDTSIDFDEDYTPPTLGKLSETLSPIAKSSSPHNCNDSVNDGLIVVASKKAKQTTDSEVEHKYDGGASLLNTSRVIVDECNAFLSTAGSSNASRADEESKVMAAKKELTSEPTGSDYSEKVRHNDTCDLEMPEAAPSPDISNKRINASGATNQQSFDDVSSFQNTLNPTSNALLQGLRGAAETRKREVTRGRYSLQRKEQIMMEEEKEVRHSTTTVSESVAVPSSRISILLKPKKKFEGVDPYKPFTARPVPSTSVKAERSRKSSVSAHIPKPPATAPARKSFAPGEDPYVPFKARPLPSANSRLSSVGMKRKPATALQPHPEQNKTTVKPAALKAKPPKRLLSGQDATNAREHAQRERIAKENAKIRRASTFKARDLPSRTVPAGLIGEKILSDALENHTDAVGTHLDKENVGASRVKRTSSIAPFTPHSTRRAEERAAFDKERDEREKSNKAERKKRMQNILEKSSAESEELKHVIR